MKARFLFFLLLVMVICFAGCNGTSSRELLVTGIVGQTLVMETATHSYRMKILGVDEELAADIAFPIVVGFLTDSYVMEIQHGNGDLEKVFLNMNASLDAWTNRKLILAAPASLDLSYKKYSAAAENLKK